MSMVKHKRGTLYTLDVQQEAELKALVNKSDDYIDYSDIPASGSDAWADAKRSNFLPNPGIHAQ
ncbi:antitoxin [Escherichia coli]|uniref:Antitoxin n=1 Tax=Escherichia coli TaxID=562 RepID=A0AAI9B7C4_ECOLX|nr:antitoxin [Escherichia coli]HDQ6534627.1 antitoxin [Escherichia coli O36:H14]ANO92268.1 antitoxin [Escherichia coli]EFI6953046.1 antitoxin [Escherichia coli]EFN1901098.1 antitoxin [Escherichia coli]EHS3285407.1 antitoxin [Escherichia coli]